MAETTATTAMVYGLIFGAQIFSFFVGVSTLTQSATAFVGTRRWPPLAVMAVVLLGLSRARLADGGVRRHGDHGADRDAAGAAASATTWSGGASS